MNELLAALTLRLVLLPLILLVATPLVLVYACFGDGAYWSKVGRCYITLADMLLVA